MTKLGKIILALSTVASFGIAASSIETVKADAFYSYYPTSIQVNGTTIITTGYINSVDPFTGSQKTVTNYFPVLHIDEALGKYNVAANLDSANSILNLTTPSSMTVNYPPVPAPMNSTENVMEIKINGQTVMYVPKINTFDSGTVNIVAFLPIGYMEQVMKYLGITTNWDGTDLSMQYGSQSFAVKGVTGPKLDAAIAFAKEIGLKPDPSGVDVYNDVPQDDWPIIHAELELYQPPNSPYSGYLMSPETASLFTTDSSTFFGSADPITATTLADAFAIYTGVGTNHQSFLPGGSTVGLASAVGLMNGVPTSGNLSSTQASKFMNNLATVEKGYVALGNNTYRLIYKPNCFRTGYYNAKVPASIWSSDWANAIKAIDATTVQHIDGEYITKTTDGSDIGWGTTKGNYYMIQGDITGQFYSLNNGLTWKIAKGLYGFDSLDPSNGGTSHPPRMVELKSTQSGGIGVRYDYNGTGYQLSMGGLELKNGQPVTAYEN